ncbi:MAG: hypothetical protein ACI9BW_002048 [Gammaproteobacteria bacterium]|jgi:hypothetical protein
MKIIVSTIVVLTFALAFLSMKPRLDRNWDDDVSILAGVELASDTQSFAISGVRNWRYDHNGPVSREYFDATYKIDDLRATSVYEQLLDPSGLIAHTFVVFDFGTNYPYPKIGVSVETRREIGEKYSLIKGALPGFELTHTWASERDLVERRVKYLSYSLSKYAVAQELSHPKTLLGKFPATDHIAVTRTTLVQHANIKLYQRYY